jgi:osmotically-inducible protein OsmY
MKIPAFVPFFTAALLAGSLYADKSSTTTYNNSRSAVVSPASSEKTYPKDQFKTDSDKAANKRIREQVTERYPESFKEIILRTSDGLVVIDGFVYSLEDQKKLTDEVEQINGIKHVVNNTKIKSKSH